jgi:hypothetical protein
MLQLEDELLEKGQGNVIGLMGRLGRPIRVRLGIGSSPYLGVKESSLYKERRCMEMYRSNQAKD